MSNWVEKLLDITVIGNDQSMVKGALANLADRFDFVGYAFVNIRPGQTYAVSNYDIDWQKIYDTLDYRFIDPVMRQAQLIRRAFAWSGEADKTSKRLNSVGVSTMGCPFRRTVNFSLSMTRSRII